MSTPITPAAAPAAARLLSGPEVMALAAIIAAAQTGETVARVDAAEPRAGVTRGTARSVGDLNGVFLAAHADVRDSYLRVTTDHGWDVFWPVAELAAEYVTGEFVIRPAAV